MTAEEEALLRKVERLVAAAILKIQSELKLRRPVAAWDGNQRVWKLRKRSANDPIQVEVLTSIATFPTYSVHPGDIREVEVTITARAWSREQRYATQERRIYTKLLKDAGRIPRAEEFEAELAEALAEADELAEQLPEAAKRLEPFLTKDIGKP
ncbi:hypothetical protein [Streptomyces peucetius]|uniref:Uncharacterized protein n=1 Tax=Streptomyces peucetius TaxID=1950 RepID=A0ABY6I8Z5_STRPE|nr:hypothetical protein [Streptomyces peucetius]UYQ62700.1 hypothetical protein OGH68_15225 [Streptomyces peucetius]